MTSSLTATRMFGAEKEKGNNDKDKNNDDVVASCIDVQQQDGLVNAEIEVDTNKSKENGEGSDDVLFLEEEEGGGGSCNSFGTESIRSFGSSIGGNTGSSSSSILNANIDDSNDDGKVTEDTTGLKDEEQPDHRKSNRTTGALAKAGSVVEEEGRRPNGRFGGGGGGKGGGSSITGGRFLQRTSSLSSRFSSFRNRASSALSSSLHSLSSKSSHHSATSSTGTTTTTTAGDAYDDALVDFDNDENLVNTLDNLLISATNKCCKTSFVILQPFKDDNGRENDKGEDDEDDFHQSASSFFSEDKDDIGKVDTEDIDRDDECGHSKSVVSVSDDGPERNSSRTMTRSLSSSLIQTMWRRDVGIEIKHDEGQKHFHVVRITGRSSNFDSQKSKNDHCPAVVDTNTASSTVDDFEHHSRNKDNVDNDSDDDDDIDPSPPSGIYWPVDFTKEVMNVPGSITVLESIDGFNCQQRCPTIDDVWVLLDRSLQEKTRTTITFATKLLVLSESSDGGATAVPASTETDDDSGDKDDVNEIPIDTTSHSTRDTDASRASTQERGIDLDLEVGDKKDDDDTEELFQDSTMKVATPGTIRLPKNSVHQAVLIVHNPVEVIEGVDTCRFDNENELGMNTHDDDDEDCDILNDTKYLELPGRFISTLTLPIADRQRSRKFRKREPIPTDTAKPNLVMVGNIPRQNHWLSDSCIQAGDTFLSINDVRTYGNFDVESTGPTFYTAVVTNPYVRIRTYGPTVRRRDRMDSFRRAAVGVAGGTLVGVGGVLMVTPLHPIGHAMAIGGVGVLGTEFEGPRKAMRNMKDGVKSGLGNSLHSLRNSVHK